MIRWGRQIGASAVLLVSAACSPLTAFNALMPKDGEGRLVVRDAHYGADQRQHIDVYSPVGPGDGPRPVIVFFYGGSWNSGVKEGYAFVGRALAAKGFIVAIPDYRLVPAVRYPAFLDDGAAAVRWVRANAARLGGDPDRIVLAGHSAGAYNAAMLALDPRLLGADRAGLRGLIGLAGPYDFLPFDTDIAREAFAGTGELPDTQPVSHVAPGAPPAFLATALDDDLVRPRNSDALAVRLNAAGTLVVRRSYGGVGHVGLVTAIARPLRYRAPVLDEMADFAAKVTARR